MSIDYDEARQEEFFDQLRDEIAGEAVSEFIEDRLRSYYRNHPEVMRPAVDALQEGKWQLDHGRETAALVFFTVSIELLLKATLLRPVIYGLIHNENLSEAVVRLTMGYSGFDRYQALLGDLYFTQTGEQLSEIQRSNAAKSLFSECQELQKLRNNVLHQGQKCSAKEAARAKKVAIATYEKVVFPVLDAIGLYVEEGFMRE